MEPTPAVEPAVKRAFVEALGLKVAGDQDSQTSSDPSASGSGVVGPAKTNAENSSGSCNPNVGRRPMPQIEMVIENYLTRSQGPAASDKHENIPATSTATDSDSSSEPEDQEADTTKSQVLSQLLKTNEPAAMKLTTWFLNKWLAEATKPSPEN